MLSFKPSFSEFASTAAGVSSVPVYATLLSDELTPVLAFGQLGKKSANAFLLESVVGGENIARYSFLGANPSATIWSRGDKTRLERGAQSQEWIGVDPLLCVQEVLNVYRASHPPELPRFVGGAVGFAGYDIARHFERLGTSPPDDRNLPDMLLGIYEQMIVFDHVRKVVHLVSYADAMGASKKNAYEQACQRIDEMAQELASARATSLHPVTDAKNSSIEFESNLTYAQFEESVERCKKYIRAGDAFQVVLSQRLSAETSADPFDVYRALRVINPSPFMFFLRSPTVTLVGSSPEILCRIEGQTVSTRPLAGTRPRGKTETQDRGLEVELRNDPKERAEHIMLVDLGRNDLGRVCEPGTVRVDDVMSVERYSHVMHLCSSVSGVLAPGKTAFDAIRSVLPVGTVSGAPKIRAMQIIDELETVRRGPYAGAVGYIDFSGNMDTCIALRTLVICPTKDGRWKVDAQAGAGIVSDSEAKTEYHETLNKATAMLAAVKMADGWNRGQ